MPIQKKYIPEIFLQLFQSAPTRKAAKRDGNQGAEKDDVDETRDSAGCAICGQEPPEVRHCHLSYHCLIVHKSVNYYRMPDYSFLFVDLRRRPM
jgi:hypothetical protein